MVKTPIARTVTINLGNDGRPVSEDIPPTDRVKVEAFLQKAFPGQTVEHTGRTSMVKLDKWGGGVRSPASLFFQTVYRAFADHHALGLRPEVLMYLINSVVAETVRRHPEDYRNLFTTQTEKMDIHVRHDGLRAGNPDSPWDEAINLFDEALRPHVPSRIMNQMLPEFTTSNTETSAVSLIAFMDAASPYYDYHTHTLCGIPRVVLFGDAMDYRRLVIAVTELAKHFEQHLAVYFTHLIPILEKIAKTAEGTEVDQHFWGSIYKQHSDSGSDRFSGWLSAFLWYVHEHNWQTETNPLMVKDSEYADWTKIDQYSGLNAGSEPTHVSRVPFTWHYFDEVLPMHFVGGILGVEVAEEALTPVLSYGVLRN